MSRASRKMGPRRSLGSGVVGIEGVDTRALTRKLRGDGAMRGAVSTEIRLAVKVRGTRWHNAHQGDVDDD